MFIALEGIDGSGKTTLAPSVCAHLREQGRRSPIILTKSIESANDEGGMLRSLRALIWGRRSQDQDPGVLGARFYLFLHAAFFSAQHRLRIQPTRQFGGAVVADGWFYRSIAKAVVAEAIDIDWALSVFDHLGSPDRVILLDIDPERAWRRRGGQFSAWELGRLSGYDGPPFDGFCRYQGQIRGVLLRLAVMFGWDVVVVGSDWDAERVNQEVVRRISAHLPLESLDQRSGAADETL